MRDFYKLWKKKYPAKLQSGRRGALYESKERFITNNVAGQNSKVNTRRLKDEINFYFTNSFAET